MQFENIIESVFKTTIENISVDPKNAYIYTISMHCVSSETQRPKYN